MIHLTELDDLAFDLILSHLNYLDLYHLSLVSRTLRQLALQSPIKFLNCTRSDSLPIAKLPYSAEHHLLDQPDWRVLKHSQGRRRDDLYLPNLYWTSQHRHFNTISLRSIALDGTRINVLDVIHFITSAPHLTYLSVRFCYEVNRLLLQNYLDSLTKNNHAINLARFDVLGIDGLSLFEPKNNGILSFDEFEIELTGAGAEYDYTDVWRENMYNFVMSLQRVPTVHGAVIETDVARCSQGYCRNFNLGRKELADPTLEIILPPCYLCQERYTKPLCRPCVSARSCKICVTFICPHCCNIDNDIEFHDFSTSQRWLQTIAADMSRAGQITAARDCRADMQAVSRAGSTRACLMMMQTHRHLAPAQTAMLSLQEGWM